MQISQLIDSIYNETTADQPAIEKTAEARLYAALSDGQEDLTENPYEQLSLEELTKLAQESGLVAEENDVSEEAMEKAAMDALGGQIMAHAAMHEFSMIKVALSNGA